MEQYSSDFIAEVGAYIHEQERILKRLNQYLNRIENQISMLQENIDIMQKFYDAETGNKKPELKRIK